MVRRGDDVIGGRQPAGQSGSLGGAKDVKILSLGEVMVELSAQQPNLWRSAFAGDTFNTAWYLAALRPGWQVSYGTRLGSDAMSDAAIAAIAAAGLGTQWITRDPQRTIGLYAISLKDGERSFTYWRGQSAARAFADDAVWLKVAIAAADVIYLSGITIAILAPEKRALLNELLVGKRVVFDPNIRPRLWESPQAMRDAITDTARRASILLPSFDDEAAAFGDASPEATAQRYAALGVAEVVVKNGEKNPAVLFDGEAVQVPAPVPVKPTDTTGAGDSFNAGYLAARLDGCDIVQSVEAGQALSALVVQHPGALTPRDVLDSYRAGSA
jgi:2-dehydro-3-deoxygluconokinase